MSPHWLWMLLLAAACLADYRSTTLLPSSSIYKKLKSEESVATSTMLNNVIIKSDLINSTAKNQTEKYPVFWHSMRKDCAQNLLFVFFTIYISYLFYILF